MYNESLKPQNTQKKENNWIVPKKLFISNQELIIHGCKNCVWKLNSQCPYGITKTSEWYIPETHGHNKDNPEKLKDEIQGICPDYMNFITSFADGGDSITAVWERFHLYIARLQSLEDYNLFKQMEEEIRQMEAGDGPDMPPKEKAKRLSTLESKKNSAKLWWSQLNEQALKSMRYVVDREKKVDSDRIIKPTIQQLNQFIQQAAMKAIEQDKK